MPDNPNPALVKWDNERARTIADRLTRTKVAIQGHKRDYVNFGIADLASERPTDNVADGYDRDGRKPITGQSVLDLEAAIDQIDAAINTTLVGTTGKTATQIIDEIQVNGYTSL